MVFVPDQHDGVVLAGVADRLEVHLGHQRARGVDHAQPAALGFITHRGRDAVRAENDRRIVRHFVELVDEDRALRPERLDDVGIVHDLLAHVDRRPADVQRELHDVDRALHARAEPARARENDLGDRQVQGRRARHHLK